MAVLVFHNFVFVLFILTPFFFLATPSSLSLHSRNKMNRKVLEVHHGVSTKDMTMVAKGGGMMHGQATRRDDKKVVMKSKSLIIGGELREVPSGPDPLHHHGAAPKNPSPTYP